MERQTIKYIVSATRLSPSTKQNGGVQGDHNVTTLKFTFDEDFLNSLKAEAKNAELWYHFELYNGEGKKTYTSSQKLSYIENDKTTVSGEILYPLPEWITRYGGVVKVELVITSLTDAVSDGATEETQTEINKVYYCFPAILQLKDRPLSVATVDKSTQNIGSLLHFANRAEAAADNAETLRDEVADLAETTKNACVVFDEDVEWIFRGGTAKNNLEIDFTFTVDDNVSESSTNPVTAKGISEFVSAELEAGLSALGENIVESHIYKGGSFAELYVIKRKNGIAELYGITEPLENIKFDRIYGALFYTSIEFTLPDKVFKDKPIWADIKTLSGNGLLFCSIKSLDNNTISAYFSNSIQLEPESFKPQFMIRAIGKWKEIENE